MYPKHMFKLMGKKIFLILRSKVSFLSTCTLLNFNVISNIKLIETTNILDKKLSLISLLSNIVFHI